MAHQLLTDSNEANSGTEKHHKDKALKAGLLLCITCRDVVEANSCCCFFCSLFGRKKVKTRMFRFIVMPQNNINHQVGSLVTRNY